MADDELLDYARLRERVGRALPADGATPSAERDKLRAYWEIGRLLDQHLSGRAAYGKRMVERLAADLGVLPRTLYRARKLHHRLPAGVEALPDLSWSHCRLLVTVADDGQLQRLMAQAAAQGWSVRQLQEHLKQANLASRQQAAPVTAARGRPGTYRIATPAGDDEDLAFDLGFGVRRPLTALGRPGKRTRRLVQELSAGDVVELTTDPKGRPALRRVWGNVAPRLYTYPARLVEATGAGVVRAELDLGLGVRMQQRLRLRGAAEGLARRRLAATLAGLSGVVVRTHVIGAAPGYAADVYCLPGETDPRAIAEKGADLTPAPADEAAA